MNIGVVFPQTEFGNDPIAIRDYAQTAEAVGFSHVLAYDHVIGANPNRPGGWQGPYTVDTPFHEPFVLFSFMAAVTRTIGFASGIIILPQRQTVLVAKQTSTLDVLCSGRLRLGIGLGWNWVEYEALNQDFHNRGRYMEEQIAVLRQLWTQPLVNFTGRWHSIPDAGIKPLPVQQPIPIWFGGHATAALQRCARLGDGWMPNYRTAEEARPAIEQLERGLAQAGRPRDRFGIEARLSYGDGNPDTWQALMRDWQAAGATHFSVNTMGHGFGAPAAHIDALRRFAAATGVTPRS
ncbi:MAG: LLM class F420-dependent oxidoreductase [Chloroflexi bacterium]|nr:LLM class F420-dependent oxidoreductase [Chloroflexota bacterium]